MTFEEEFDAALAGRTQVKDLITSILSTHETDKIGFFKVDGLNYDEVNDMGIPGWQIFLLGKNCKAPDYKYYVLDINLPNGTTTEEFPVEVTFNSLSGSKNMYIADINGLQSYLEHAVFNSPEYRAVINRLESALF